MERRVAEPLQDPLLRRIAQAAQREGLSFEAVPMAASGHGFRKKVARINGALCSIRVASRCFRDRSWRSYYCFHIDLPGESQCRTQILCIEDASRPLSLFVVPQGIIEERRRDVRKLSIYIPVEKDLPVYNNVYPKVDWHQFKDAWHLLRAQE